jgi:hypothetical protein
MKNMMLIYMRYSIDLHSVSANTHSPYPSQTPLQSAVGTTDIVTLDFNPGYKLDFNPGTKKSVVVGEV